MGPHSHRVDFVVVTADTKAGAARLIQTTLGRPEHQMLDASVYATVP